MAAEDVRFEALITPHRSLTRRGRLLVLAALALLSCVTVAGFVRAGAWPIAGFSAAMLALASLMFFLNTRAARAGEVLTLSDQGVRIVRTAPDGTRRETHLPTAWLSVHLDEPPGRVPVLTLSARHRHEEIGATLGEAEKRDLAAALRAALYRQQHPSFDNPQLTE